MRKGLSAFNVVSIALGLTVLTFLFTMTQVPIEAVALKLFTGIENFEIMAIPFFILAGNFLTHGGVARRMIAFATTMIGHWYGGLGLAGVMACALFAAISGSSPATVVAIGAIVMPAMVAQGFPKRFGAGVIATRTRGAVANRSRTYGRIAAVLTLVSAPHPSADAHALNPPRVPCHPGTQYISGGGWHPGYVFGARCEPIHAPNNPNAFKHRN